MCVCVCVYVCVCVRRALTVRYPWNVLVFPDLALLPEVHTMNWQPGMRNITMGDVGVNLLDYFSAHADLRLRAITGVTVPCVSTCGSEHAEEGVWELMAEHVRRECHLLQRRGVGRGISFQLWEGGLFSSDCLPVCLSVWPFLCILSVCLSVCLSACLSVSHRGKK